tara:strand:- start:149 stop:349 length:201 start_codon:yes stop_codon:yes gene_type:complete
METFFTSLQGLNWEFVIDVALQTIGLFALVASATPNESDNKIAAWLLKAINVLGANFNRASNDTNA